VAGESLQRVNSLTTRLIRVGIRDSGMAMSLLMQEPLAAVFADEALDDLDLAPDPDQALRALADIATVAPGALQLLAHDAGARHRALAVMGMSKGIAQHLVKRPEDLGLLATGGAWERLVTPDAMRSHLFEGVGADHTSASPFASLTGVAARDSLRVRYRQLLMCIAALDLAHGVPVDGVVEMLSDLADSVVQTALAIAMAELPPSAEPCRFAIIAMGKCGGRELNYVSDVDVIFVAEPLDDEDDPTDALRTATTLATGVISICQDFTTEGSIWQVDAALRPEGKDGALVRTLRSHVGYYERWAETWEFQALLKARACAGDAALGTAYVDAILPMVWTATSRPDFVSDVQRMRKRVEREIAPADLDRELKLGPGGLRDVEFSVQLLQLVHGRTDPRLRSRATLEALDVLAECGYVGREDAAVMASSYRFERAVEHRIQLLDLRRTHMVPTDELQLRTIARSLQLRTTDKLDQALRHHSKDIRRIHEKLFYRPLLQAVARLDAGDARLSLEQAVERLRVLGFRDPDGAMRHVEALTTGVSRRAAIQRTLLPVLLGWFAQTPMPDQGLLGFRRVSDALGATPWYLRLLRDDSVVAERMSRILCYARLSTELLLTAPEAVSMLEHVEDLRPRSLSALLGEFRATAERQSDAAASIHILRSLRRRELFRVSSADILGQVDPITVCRALSDITEATLVAASEAVIREWEHRHGVALPTRFAIVAMGRFGGRELSYGSDADVMFVHDPVDNGADCLGAAVEVASMLTNLLARPGTEPPLLVDADLRPEGRSGSLVRSLQGYAKYYEQWSLSWESQALLRARPFAGDERLRADFITLIDSMRYPEKGLPETEVREIRRIKARVESERLPRGADVTLHMKLGRGGLADVEWLVQLLQLQHAADIPALRELSTIAALAAARDAQFVTPVQHDTLRDAWLMATRIRNVQMLVTGKSQDQVSTDLIDLRLMSDVLGLPSGAALLEDYRRVTRRARVVFDEVFYGITPYEDTGL
jgi:glutamate-ammonia-ligase adenylyltransferase